MPWISNVAVLWNPTNPAKVRQWAETQSPARTLGLNLQSLEVRGPDEFESAFTAATEGGADALVLFGDELMARHSPRIAELEVQSRLPAIHEGRIGAPLMVYGPNVISNFRRSAYYVDRILKGTSPADLPIEQPREFDFVINLNMARALGFTIPEHVLLQATEVIQ